MNKLYNFNQILPFSREIQFPELNGKMVSELNDEQAKQAHEDWIRQQFGHMAEYYRPLLSLLLHVIDEQREALKLDLLSKDLQWKARMRGIKRWQAAHPGNELMWPDQGDLIVWLLEELERQRMSWWQRLLHKFASL